MTEASSEYPPRAWAVASAEDTLVEGRGRMGEEEFVNLARLLVAVPSGGVHKLMRSGD